MKVKYEFEINKKEYHKVLCEGCPMLTNCYNVVMCNITGEFQELVGWNCESEKSRYDAMSYLESKCPLEVVE